MTNIRRRRSLIVLECSSTTNVRRCRTFVVDERATTNAQLQTTWTGVDELITGVTGPESPEKKQLIRRRSSGI